MFLLICKESLYFLYVFWGMWRQYEQCRFVSKWVSLLFNTEGFSPSRPQREQRTTGQNWRGSGKVQTAYPSRLSTTCHLWAWGDLDHNLIFLIPAAFNSFLQMANTVGRIGLLLPGHCNMHVCLISRHREKDDAVHVVINLDFKKSPSVVESEVILHCDWTSTLFYLS